MGFSLVQVDRIVALFIIHYGIGQKWNTALPMSYSEKREPLQVYTSTTHNEEVEHNVRGKKVIHSHSTKNHYNAL